MSFVGHFCEDISIIFRGGGYPGFEVIGDNRKSFLSLEISIPGFFGVGKFGLKAFFWGA